MISILQSFVQTVSALIMFVINSISSLLRLIVHIPEYVAFLTTSINVLPAIIIPFALASISLGAVLFILGR